MCELAPPPDADAGAAKTLRHNPRLEGFGEEQHRVHGTVLALSTSNQQSLALQKQAMRLENAEGTVLQKQTARLVRGTTVRARRAPERALSRR